MAQDTLKRYIWLIDTIRRYGHISRAELDRLWQRSSLGDGNPLARRTLYNYRQAIEELFGIEIKTNTSTYEYYIANDNPAQANQIAQWLVNSNSVSELLASAASAADKIILEHVPSAGDDLATAVQALKENRTLQFDYQSLSRPKPTVGINLTPLLVKLFRQRWYLTGIPAGARRIKTYALDRIRNLTISQKPPQSLDEDFDPAEYFAHSFGIVVTQAPPKHVILKTTPLRAKYLREIPLHSSQREEVNDDYSLFNLHIRISDDFIEEILRYSNEIEVIAPPELRQTVAQKLRQAADLYETRPDAPNNSPKTPFYF